LTEEVRQSRSDEEIGRIQATGGREWQIIRWIRRRRPVFTALLVLAALAHTLVYSRVPYDLLTPSWSARFLVVWTLIVVGVAIRLWGSGNLRKNQEITYTGVYRLVRHPLYLGSLCFLLAYYLTIGSVVVGLFLFAVLLIGVFYPTMLAEEEYLTIKFPQLAETYRPPPRLIPDVRRIGEALATDRFQLRAAYRNLGFRSLLFIPLLPLVLRVVRWIQGAGVG